MNANQIAQQFTRFIEWAISNPVALLVWIASAIAAISLLQHALGGVGAHGSISGLTLEQTVWLAGGCYLLTRSK